MDSERILLTDNGAGGLLLAGKPLNGASIDYGTGTVRILKKPLSGSIAEAVNDTNRIAAGAPAYTYTAATVQADDRPVKAEAQAVVLTVNGGDTRPVQSTVSTGLLTFNILDGVPHPRTALLNTWRFDVDGKPVLERDGVLYQDWDYRTGKGTEIGRLDPLEGTVRLRGGTSARPQIRILGGAYAAGRHQIGQVCGHTAAAPLKPQSFIAHAGNAVGRSDKTGAVSGGISGSVDVETGYFELTLPENVHPESLRYNAVAQSQIPLDSRIIGINAVRLPQDGKVPVFRAGDTVVIHNSLKQDIGGSFSAGQTLRLQRQDCDRICLIDAKGKHVSATLYDSDLDGGTLTFARPLDLSDYAMPLTAVQTWEEMNRIVHADISGSLKLQHPLTRDYPADNTLVSSALLFGDLMTRATEPFYQKNWHGRWQDAPEGDPVLARLNVRDHPLALTADGAVTERWLLRFTSDSQFELYGENLGLVAESDTLQELAPPNPATGRPYFRLPAAAFGGGWERGYVVRFNTHGAIEPVWIVRVIQPSSAKTRGADGFAVCLRGNTEVLDD